jgi:hypothetical protein
MSQHVQLQDDREGHANKEVAEKFIEWFCDGMFIRHMIAQPLDAFFQFRFRQAFLVPKIYLTGRETYTNVIHPFPAKKSVD